MLSLVSESTLELLSGSEIRGLSFLESVLSEAKKCELSAPGVVRIPNYHKGVNVLLMVERTIIQNQWSKWKWLILEVHCFDYCTAIIVQSDTSQNLPITDYLASFILLAESDFGHGVSFPYTPCMETLDLAVEYSLEGDVRVGSTEHVWIAPNHRATLRRGQRRIISPWKERGEFLHHR